MSDDDRYLWDGSGPPDPEVVRLEAALRPLRHQAALGGAPARASRPALRRRVLLGGGIGLAAAAGTALWLGAGRPRSTSSGSGIEQVAPPPTALWTVAALAGSPRLADGRGAGVLAGSREAGSGAVIETDGASRARISMGAIGQVEIDARTRVRLVAAGAGAHRLGLDRGVMHALIWAPPGRFQVETAAGVVTDLGCAYTLALDGDGSGRVSVSSGWVGFEYDGRESLIPAGASATIQRGRGPGTPAFDEGSARLRGWAATLEAGMGGPRAEPLDHRQLRHARVVLADARPVDALTLWHLLPRVPAVLRGPVHDRLAALVPPPPAVTRAGILAGDRQMHDHWWDALGFGPIADWRRWRASGSPLP